MKTGILLVFILAFSILSGIAQTRVLTGTVSSSEDGLPIPGVSVSVKGTTMGTISDVNGVYLITIPGVAKALVFSFVGMRSQEVAITTAAKIDVTLMSEVIGVDEVVVTALGITREKKSLGYATQEVKGEIVNSVKSANFANALSGKISGVQVQRNQNMGGSTNVIVRGSKSLQGSNQVLYVVDGVPINNNIGKYTAIGVTSGQAAAVMGYDYGNAASDIDPESIESINVLKGSAATALYGSRASGGVIMITTKKGKFAKAGEKSRIGVSVNSSFTTSSIDKSTFPTYQDQYGAGYDGTNAPNAFIRRTTSGSLTTTNPADPLVRWVDMTQDGSFGPKFDGQPVWGWYSVDPESPWYKQSKPWEFSKNGPLTFFETPRTLSNTVAIDKSTELGTMRLSYTNYNTEGLMPNSSLNKDNLTLNGTWIITNKLTVAASANYIKQKAKGRNTTGYNGNLVSNFRQWLQTNLDYKDQKTAYELTKRNITWNYNAGLTGPIYSDNPYWMMYENYQNDTRTRFIGNASINYKVTSWLEVFGRVSADSYNELQEERRAVGSVPGRIGIDNVPVSVGSGYVRRDNTFSEYNYDLMLNFKKKINESFNLNGVIGFNERRTKNTYFSNGTIGGLIVPRVYSLQNSVGTLSLPIEVDQTIGVRSMYASVSLGYKDFLFLDGTFRQDYASTLPEGESKYQYPSITGAFLFSNILNKDWLSLGKLRLNYAQVGNLAGFDMLQDVYVANSAFNGSSNRLANTKKNPNLKSERTNSVETGIELSFFKSRLGFDVAVYKTNSKDQIMPLPVSQTTGFQNLLVNAGELENKGVEIALNANPVKIGDFSWDITVNWAKNMNEVVSLYPGITNLRLNSANLQSGVTINAEVGQPYGVIKGTDFTYDANGKKIINAITGNPVISTRSDISIGSFTPDWTGGIYNSFTYKNVSLGFLIDIQKGGDIYSLDMWYGMGTGLYPETAFINDLGNQVRDPLVGTPGNYASNSGGYIIEGVNVANGISTPNVTRVNASKSTGFGYGNMPKSEFVYDAGYVKLREVSISYVLPSSILKKTFIRGASISVVGSNLWILSKSLPYADPESGMSAGNIQGYSVGSLPSTRDFSFNLKFNF